MHKFIIGILSVVYNRMWLLLPEAKPRTCRLVLITKNPICFRYLFTVGNIVYKHLSVINKYVYLNQHFPILF